MFYLLERHYAQCLITTKQPTFVLSVFEYTRLVPSCQLGLSVPNFSLFLFKYVWREVGVLDLFALLGSVGSVSFGIRDIPFLLLVTKHTHTLTKIATTPALMQERCTQHLQPGWIASLWILICKKEREKGHSFVASQRAKSESVRECWLKPLNGAPRLLQSAVVSMTWQACQLLVLFFSCVNGLSKHLCMPFSFNGF